MFTYRDFEDVVKKYANLIELQGIRRCLFYAPWGWGYDKDGTKTDEYTNVRTTINTTISNFHGFTRKIKMEEPELYFSDSIWVGDFQNFFLNNGMHDLFPNGNGLDETINAIGECLKDDVNPILRQKDKEAWINTYTKYAGQLNYKRQKLALIRKLHACRKKEAEESKGDFIFHAFLFSVRWSNVKRECIKRVIDILPPPEHGPIRKKVDAMREAARNGFPKLNHPALKVQGMV